VEPGRGNEEMLCHVCVARTVRPCIREGEDRSELIVVGTDSKGRSRGVLQGGSNSQEGSNLTDVYYPYSICLKMERGDRDRRAGCLKGRSTLLGFPRASSREPRG